MWTFPPSPKLDPLSCRVVPAEETELRVLAVRSRLPITRVVDLTPLDPLRLPVFSAVTPLARDLTTHMGKGPTARCARVSALMEAVERVSAESAPPGATRRARFTELVNTPGLTVLDPTAFHLPDDTHYTPEGMYTWLESQDLLADTPVLMAADLVLNPPLEGILRDVDTNGLASGNTRLEAVVHALCEVIERDVQSQLEFVTTFGDATLPMPPLEKVQPASVPASARGWLEQLSAMGIEPLLHDATNELGVATFRTILVDHEYPTARGPVPLGFSGWGTAPQAETALLRSLTEAVQSRLAFIQGARDSFNVGFEDAPATHRSHRLRELMSSRTSAFSRTPSFEASDLRADLEFLLERLRASGFHRVLVTDLTRPDLGIPVVRVRVPGLSCFTVNRRRLDWACLRYLL